MSPSPAFRTALRGLIAASVLLLALVAVIRFFPGLSASNVNAALAADKTSVARPSAVAEPSRPMDSRSANTRITSAFSGSAVIQPEFSRVSQAATSAVDPETIAVNANDDFDADCVPLPPIDEVRDDLPQVTHEHLDRLDRRIGELERTTATDRARQELLPLIERIHAQAQTTSEIARRMEQVERRAESLAETSRESASPISIDSIDENGQRRWNICARNASLPEFLVRLGEAAGLNLIVSPDVTGDLSLHLRGSDADAVLDAVCKICRCRLSRSGNFVVVLSEAVPIVSPAPATPATISKLYRLKHLSGADLQPYVQSLLTPGLGTCGFAQVREGVAHATDPHPPQAILVKDTAHVLAEIDRLLIELDHPFAGVPESPAAAELRSEPKPIQGDEISPQEGGSFDLPVTAVNTIRSR